MAFSSLHWEERVNKTIDEFVTKSKELAKQYNDPYTIERVFSSVLEEYEKLLESMGPLKVS